MKTIRNLALAALVTLLPACATTRPQNLAEPDLASRYIHAIESAARNHAVEVIWINPPKSDQVARILDRDGG